MKDKPVSHKNLNTFHFLTSAERINKIDVCIYRQTDTYLSTPDEKITYLWEAFEKWRDLDYSISYEEFRKDIGDEIQTLVQLLYRKDAIVEVFLKHLNKEENLALPALLELTVALARDLQDQLYPHFPDFFTAIKSHLSTKDTELLEKLFLCLAFLFKFFSRYIVQDIKNVYGLFSSLLNDTHKEYIRKFACESFAALLRTYIRSEKKTKQEKDDFFILIFSNLQQNPEQTYGVGQLFFEVVKGVKEQFHFCLEQVFKLLLRFLGKTELSSALVEESLIQMLTSMATHTVQKHCVKVQEIFGDVVSELLGDIEGTEAMDAYKVKHLDHVLHLLLFWIKFKNGKLITPDKGLIEVVLKLCSLRNLPQYCMNSVVEITSSVMLSRCLNLPMDKVNAIISQIYSHSEETAIFFTRSMFQYGMFEKDILPVLLSVCLKMIQSEIDAKKTQVLEILSESITALKPLTETGDDIKSFSKLYFHPNSSKVQDSKSVSSDVLEKFLLETLQCDNIKSNTSKILSALTCIPHIRLINKDHAYSMIETLSQKVQDILLSTELLENKLSNELTSILYQAHFAYLIIANKEKRSETCFNTRFFLDLLKKFPDSVNILRMMDDYLNSLTKAPIIEDLADMISTIVPNLASPFHLVRLFTLRILKTFDLGQTEKEVVSVFTICYEAEVIPLDVQSYREKLKWIRKLEYEFIEKNLPASYAEHLTKAAIYYIIGMLYVNFKLLWEPSMKILETLAHGKPELFWDIFSPHLNASFDFCVRYNLGEDVYQAYNWQSREKVDLFNHHTLLWKAMETFSDVAERKNKTVVPLLLQLMVKLVESSETVKKRDSGHVAVKDSDSEMKTEMEVEDFDDDDQELDSSKMHLTYKNKSASEKFQATIESDKSSEVEEMITADLNGTLESIQEQSENGFELKVNGEDGTDDEDSDNESDYEELEHSKPVSSKKEGTVARRFQVSKMLAAYLSVFAKFRNPKGGYKADELQRLYKELLSYSDPTIQKLAFDCIMTFSYKHLTPYKDNFYRILDNKTFKTEIVLFSLDAENTVIAEEHRMEVLDILMRILYGKMLSKTGNNTTGKAQASARRSLVLRFLAGCRAEELRTFFELVFIPFKEQLKDDTLTAVKKITGNIDILSIVPIRKQHSALNTLGLILQHLGNLVPELLPYLLKVLLIITATSSTLLKKQDEVLPQCLGLLKSVRTLAIMKLIQFFKTFEDYKFIPEEIDAVFESIIWTMLPRLEFDSVNQPSPLLRLFSVWSENPRYFILFAKHHENFKSLSPLRHILDLYCSNRSKPRVVGVVSKMIYQLLCAEEKGIEEEPIKKITPIEINFCLTLPEIDVDDAPCTLGTKLLYPYVDKILRRFEMTVAILAKRKFKKSLPARDLTILLRISRFVEDPKLSFKLIELLPPFLLKPKIDADSEILILNTISSLLRKSENPDYFVKLFAPLFGRLTNQNSRTALVCVFSTIAEIRPEMLNLTNIVSKLNAFDPSLIGEPDYQSRLDGHKETLEVIKNMDETSFNEDFIRIVIFNSSYTIKTCNDLALRGSSSYMLQELAKILFTTVHSSAELTKLLLLETFMPEIQKGIKNSSESVRHEFIQILSAVLDSWKDLPALQDLVMLCHEDKELDFWENIRHLQVHRRARALLRFANMIKKQCEDKETIHIYYLTSYMLPIVTSFLFNASYKKHVHVIDAAIETLGCIALALPWRHYEPLLKQYLQLLGSDAENHKTIIKIIVSLLDAFHFQTSSKRTAAPTETLPSKKPALDSTETETPQLLSPNENTEITIPEPVSINLVVSSESSPDESFKIYTTIKRNILPLLHRSLMRKTKGDDEHKLAGKVYPEDEEILRVPIALAMVKLLQTLPSESLDKNLPGLFLRMCELLKTRTESIRETARETLVKMMVSLGPKYFRCLLSEMKGVMSRGYQVHVMTYTINAVLIKLVEMMEPGDLDSSAVDLSQVCMNELFSDVAEEKEVDKITGKLKEARSVKSYSIFKVLSRFVSEEFLLEIIRPLKEEIGKRHSHKILEKVSKCLQQIAQGLSENKSVDSDKQLVFIHAVINESMPGLNKKRQEEIMKAPKYERPDCFLIPKEPGRSGPPAKINKRTTDHVFVEFGLQLFHFSLKKDRFEKDKKEILEMLDPFVPLLADCLSSNHIKIITMALQCLKPMYKFPLPSFRIVTRKIVNSLFIIVNKYAGIGMGQGEKFEMILMCFKVFTILVKDTNYHTLSEEQLQSLLSYIEQDIYDYTRQATAFKLLKAVLSKKLQAPELRGIMSKIAEMSITAEQDNVRNQCRQVCLQYMLDYPLGKQLEKSITFFLAQLDYNHEHGRVSAMEMINSMLNDFPEDVLKKYSALYLVPLAARLVNDVEKCRKMAAQCIKKLLTKVQHDGRLSLFSIAFTWLQDKKVSHKRLGAQLCGMFAEVEGEEFEHHLHEILPIVTELICAAKTEKIKSDADERSTDHFLYHVLNALTKMLTSCSVIKKKEFADGLYLLWDELQGLILYPHVWVRLATSQLFDLLLSSYTVEEIERAICKKKKSKLVFLNSRQKLRDLSADFSTQLQSPYLNEKLGEKIVRNLVYLARVISRLPEESSKASENGESIVDVTLEWMIRKLCREAKKEVAETPTNIQRRKCVFMFMAAFAHVMGREKLLPLLNNMLIPLCREVTDGSKTSSEELKKCAQEVLDLIKTIVGVEDFSSMYADVQTFLFRKKVKRKQEKAQEAVTNPQKYAEKRIKKQLSKKESKKRKIMQKKGKRKVVKKTKLSDLVIAKKITKTF